MMMHSSTLSGLTFAFAVFEIANSAHPVQATSNVEPKRSAKFQFALALAAYLEDY